MPNSASCLDTQQTLTCPVKRSKASLQQPSIFTRGLSPSTTTARPRMLSKVYQNRSEKLPRPRKESSAVLRENVDQPLRLLLCARQPKKGRRVHLLGHLSDLTPLCLPNLGCIGQLLRKKRPTGLYNNSSQNSRRCSLRRESEPKLWLMTPTLI